MDHANQMKSLLLCLWSVIVISTHAAEIDFTRDVRPIFSENCFHCHGFDAKARKADLRMDEESSAKQFIEVGNADQSELIHRLESTDPDEIMPPRDSHRSLTAEQIATVKQWINEGAKWGGHWAFESIDRTDRDFGNQNPIDVLVQQKLDEQNIQPNPRAPKSTLIRRASLDLTGLPPTPSDLEAFEKDGSPEAWGKVVDRLLASPHYGERMAWNWLNAARYADSNGYQGDRERTMWPWRDWVVSAFNQNLPYDQFTIWQLAGDLLESPTQDQILATGFNRNHMINGEGGRIAEENRVDYVFDMAETMSTVWLGLTLNCCRCHDHKFDPLTQKEYYQFTAFFNQTPVTGGGGDPQTRPVIGVPSEEQAAKDKLLAETYRLALQAENAMAKQLIPGQTEWEKNYPVTTEWRVLSPTSATATKVTLTILDDQSVLATGANPDRETHTVKTASNAEKITAIKLEALQHKTFTNQGKGLSRSDSGNFVLTEFEILAGDRPVKIKSAKASHEQNGLTVNRTYDGNPNSGWAVLDKGTVDRPHEAVFILDEAVSGPLTFTLRHDSVHKAHFLGRLRLSATSNPSPRADQDNAAFTKALKTPQKQRTKAQADLISNAFRLDHPDYRKFNEKTKKAKSELDAHRKNIPKVMVMDDMGKPRKTYILNQGLYDSPKDEVSAAVPAIFDPLDNSLPADRLALAKWLVKDDHPLTARVTVNRIWQLIFGTGLVKTVEDFGVQSEYPPHPELLDWLASDFIASGWDVKKLLRTILTSETYQRSSTIPSREAFEADPDNRLLARGSRYRLPSWMIRDQALAAAGMINPQIGGPGFNPYQPPGIWEEATFGKKKYTEATGDDLYRRSLYVFWRRIVGPTMFFASSKRQICEVKIARTNTPMHALSTLNDVTYVEASRCLAEEAIRNSRTTQDRFDYIGRRILSRVPTSREKSIWLRNLERGLERFHESPQDAAAFISLGDSKPDATISPAESAAWANLCLTLLNLDETLNRE